jgi:hypothetical protein
VVRKGTSSLVVDLVRDRAPQIDAKDELGTIRIDTRREIMANKLCALLSRCEIRDLVDVRALEQAGLRVEDHLPFASQKDAGLTVGQLAWVLSSMEIGDDASVPDGTSVPQLRSYLADLLRRLAELAYPDAAPLDEP